MADALNQSQPNAEQNNDGIMESQAPESATNSKENTNEVREASTADSSQVEEETFVAMVPAPSTPSADGHSVVLQNTTPEKSPEKEPWPGTPVGSDPASDTEAFSPLRNTALARIDATDEPGVNAKKERSPSILKKACTPSPRGIDKKKNRVNFPMDPVASVHVLSKESVADDGQGLLSPCASSSTRRRGSPVRADQTRLDFDFNDESNASDGADVVVHRSPASAARALFNTGGLRASPGAQRLQMLNFGPRHSGGEPLKVLTSADVSPFSSQSPSKENATVANNSPSPNERVEDISVSTQFVVATSVSSEANANQAEQELPPLPAMDNSDTMENASDVKVAEVMDVSEPATDAANVETMSPTASSAGDRHTATEQGVPSSESTVNADDSPRVELAAKAASTLPDMQLAVDAAIHDAMQAENVHDRRRRLLSVQRELIKILGIVNEALVS